MQKSNFNKKDWLLRHAEFIIKLQKDGYTHTQIIQYLKTDKKMPFDIGLSLFSKHLKSILDAQQEISVLEKQTHQINSLGKYTEYLERSNKDLLLKLNNLKEIQKQNLEKNSSEELQQLKQRYQMLKQEFLDQHHVLETLKLQNFDFQKILANLQEKNDELLLKNLELVTFNAIKNENINLKADLKRFKACLEESARDSSSLTKKLNTAQMRAKQNLLVACAFAFLAMVFFGLFLFL